MDAFIDNFFKRIQYKGNNDITFEDIRILMNLFAKHVPFENVDIIEKKDVTIDQTYLETKIIEKFRGGLCYELNPLFYYVLKELGFYVWMVSGTVGSRESLLKGTHIAVILQKNDERYVIDVGFGSNLALQPLPFTGEFVSSVTGSYRIIKSDMYSDEYVYEKYVNDKRVSKYIFTLEPIDESHINHVKDLITTHPKSSFNKSILLVKLTDDGHMTLTDETFTTVKNGNKHKRDINFMTMKQLSSDKFGISLDHIKRQDMNR